MNDWLDGAFALPTRDGQDVGGAQERTMLTFAQGATGIRTVEELNPDGTITALRTRYGRPTFETTEGRRTATPAPLLRGFVAQIPGGRAVLFDPLTLDILNQRYTPAGKPYEVQWFATTWGVPDGVDTYRCDVVLFDYRTIKVNATPMPLLRIDLADHGFPAIPHLIAHTDSDSRYGNFEDNGTKKRVFAVGRYAVKSWGGEGVVETLMPELAREEKRAVTAGPRIHKTTPLVHDAYLGQIYHTDKGWDGPDEWLYSSDKVSMLLTGQYLIKMSAEDAFVALPRPDLEVGEDETGVQDYEFTFDTPTPIALIGTAVVSYLHWHHDPRPPDPRIEMRWPWTGVHITDQMKGVYRSNYTRETYAAGSADLSVGPHQLGEEIEYFVSNDKHYGVSNEAIYQKGQSLYVGNGHTRTTVALTLSGGRDDSTRKPVPFWGKSTKEPDPEHEYGWAGEGSTRGINRVDVTERKITGSDVTGVLRDSQGVRGSVMVGEKELVLFEFGKEYSKGAQAHTQGDQDYYDNRFTPGPIDPETEVELYPAGWGDIYYYAGVGWGWASFFNASLFVYPGGLCPYLDYYEESLEVPPDEKKDPDVWFWQPVLDTFLPQTLIMNEGLGAGIYDRAYYITTSIDYDVTKISSKLLWKTRDFILYDKINRVYVSVDAELKGSSSNDEPGLVALKVKITIETRYMRKESAIAEFSWWYDPLFVETEIPGSGGRTAIPTPQIRAMFAPMYQEQGSFKGAHYVTMEEEANGAEPFHGFNFIVYLRMYEDIDYFDSDNTGPDVHFVPFNLLEMLHAYVFSNQYGASTTSRYPIDFPLRYAQLQQHLFNIPYRVSRVYSNTVDSPIYTDRFGGDFSAIANVSLHRT
jgi:hypothetical protein